MSDNSCAFTGHRRHKFPWRYNEADNCCVALNAALTAGRTAFITVNDSTERRFTIKKVDTQNKASIQGAVFRFEQIDGSFVTTGTTDFDGTIEFQGDSLPYGVYRVTEQTPPKGYVKSDRVETVEWDGKTSVFLPIVPVFVATRTDASFGLAEGTAEFLAGASVIGCLSVLVHGKARVANEIAGKQFLVVFRIAPVQRDNGFSLVNILHQVVDRFHIIALVAQEGTLAKGEGIVGGGKYSLNNGGIRHIGRSSQFIKRQAGNAVHQHMAFVSPVKPIPPLIVLVGGGMNAQRTVRIGFGMVFRFELILGEGFRIVLLCVCRNRGGVQADEGSIHNAQLVEFSYLLCYDFLQFPIIQFFEEAVISPVRWQRLHDVKATVMGDDAVVIQIICQIGDLREALAPHDNKSADHGFFRKAPPSSRRSGQHEVQSAKEFVVEHSGALGCEQCYILNNFLSVDSGQLLSG